MQFLKIETTARGYVDMAHNILFSHSWHKTLNLLMIVLCFYV
jgi:hypothetical protein